MHNRLHVDVEEAGLATGFFVPAIQAIAFQQTRPIPPTELPPSAFNVPARPDVQPSISFPLMVFLVRAAQLPTTPLLLIGPADGVSVLLWLAIRRP